jgi:hypothetical protein
LLDQPSELEVYPPETVIAEIFQAMVVMGLANTLRDIIENEFFVLHACRSLLPGDTIADAVIAPLKGIGDKALLVYRFDRLRSGARIHFEEFNQVLGHRSGDDKYIGHRHDARLRTGRCLTSL